MDTSSLFLGRDDYLTALDRLWQARKPELLILYGRKRVGKTRLLSEWIGRAGPRVLFWAAERSSAEAQLRSFSQAVLGFEAAHPLPASNFSFSDWRIAFQELVRRSVRERLMIVVEGFAHLLEATPGVASYFQHIWDHEFNFPDTNALLVLVGGHKWQMIREALSYRAPLYGRATALIDLQPLRFPETRAYFPAYSPEARLAVWAMVGGLPGYWRFFDPDLALSENIRRCFLSDNPFFWDEPELLLRPHFHALGNYAALLRALAAGAQTPKAIALQAGVEDRQVSMYLQNLRDTGYVARLRPVTAGPMARRGRHVIQDPFLNFYYALLEGQRRALVLGRQDEARHALERGLEPLIAARAWVEICREWSIFAMIKKQIPIWAGEMGGVWTRRAQIEIVAFNREDKTLLLGTCAWGSEAAGPEILHQLLEKTALALPKFSPKKGRWRVFYLGFARRGWTAEAHTFVADLPAGKAEDGRWEGIGMKLLDLVQVDRDLTAWVVPGDAPDGGGSELKF